MNYDDDEVRLMREANWDGDDDRVRALLIKSLSAYDLLNTEANRTPAGVEALSRVFAGEDGDESAEQALA
jgi:hypothetical protein